MDRIYPILFSVHAWIARWTDLRSWMVQATVYCWLHHGGHFNIPCRRMQNVLAFPPLPRNFTWGAPHPVIQPGKKKLDLFRFRPECVLDPLLQ
jgi:hypothetical protein